MATFHRAEELKRALGALPQVASVDEIKVENDIIKHVTLEAESIGKVTVHQLDVNDAAGLFDFYSHGLSEKPRRQFAPYPLFHTPPVSADELACRIADWKRENDWTAVNLVKDRRIIGFGLLKRFKSEQVTSAIVIRDEFLKKGLGYLLQNIIIEQARLLNLKMFHVKVVSDNLASVRLHEKCGFRQTKVLPSAIYEEIFKYLSDCDRMDGGEAVERQLIEMAIELGSTTEMDKSFSIDDSAGATDSKMMKKNSRGKHGSIKNRT